MTNERQVVRGAGAEIVLRREPWDCAQLGLESAKLEALVADDDGAAEVVAREAVALAREQGFVHLASRVSVTDRRGQRALQAAGFKLVDTVVSLSLRPERFQPPQTSAGLSLRWAVPDDGPAIGVLAADSFSDEAATFNRYLNDPRLSLAQVRKVYSVWGSTSVGGAAADATLLAVEGPRIIGFLTLKRAKADGLARVPLNAVAPDQRGRGVYAALVSKAAATVFSEGASKLEVTTQLQQLAVQRTWLRLGGELEGAHYSFHCWPEVTTPIRGA